MRYIKGEHILPPALLEEIQGYADGVYLYIPRRPKNRQRWGSSTGCRSELDRRNREIRDQRQGGMTIPELAEKYQLSKKSIGRILRTKEEA